MNRVNYVTFCGFHTGRKSSPPGITRFGGARIVRGNGYTVRELTGGDFLVSIRHDGYTDVAVRGDDPQAAAGDEQLTYTGEWRETKEKEAKGGVLHTASRPGAAAVFFFTGNQVRLAGSVSADGGLADGVYRR